MKRKGVRTKLLLFSRKLVKRNIPITLKLLLSYAFILTCMISLSYITFNFYKKDRAAIMVTDMTQLNNQAVSKIDDYFQNLRSLTKLPLFREQTNDSFFTEYDKFNKTRKKSILLESYTNWISYKTVDSNSSTHSVSFYNMKGDSLSYVNGGAFTSSINPVHEAWFKKTLDGFGKTFIIGTHNIPNMAFSNGKPSYVFSVARAIVDLADYKIAGIMLVNIKISYLSDLCKKTVTIPKQRMIIMDDSDNTIYDMKETNISQPIDPSIKAYFSKNTDGTKYARINGIDYLLRYDTSLETGWKIINIIPITELNKGINKIKVSTAVITVLLVLLTFIIILVISRQIVQPLRKLVILMKLVEKGDFDVKIEFTNRDEIGQLAKTFNKMTNRINKLINEVYVDKVKRKELELHMLQYQINPHFLYNTLESIQMMSLINNDEETSKMVFALGKILRYGINQKNEIVTVKEELSNLEDYTMLQKIRFEDIYEININVDSSLYENKMIKLILQPTIENAIYHGLRNRNIGGVINVSGYTEDNTMVFQISDNGIGMDEEMVIRLNEYVNDQNDSFTSIGLKNINKRIKLRYGDDYGIYISSQYGVGSTVKVIFPVEK